MGSTDASWPRCHRALVAEPQPAGKPSAGAPPSGAAHRAPEGQEDGRYDRDAMARSWTSDCDSPPHGPAWEAASQSCVIHSSLGMILQRGSARWRKAIFTAGSKTSTELHVLPTRRSLSLDRSRASTAPAKCPVTPAARPLRSDARRSPGTLSCGRIAHGAPAHTQHASFGSAAPRLTIGAIRRMLEVATGNVG